MKEDYYQAGSDISFLRHGSLQPGRRTLVFLHGIGDSSLSYLPFLEAPELQAFNILLPDLLGYGKSSVSDDYGFEHQVKVLIEHLRALERTVGFTFDDMVLVAHSMGNIHALMLCESEMRQQIKAVVNVEGSVTQYGSFVSAKAAAAVEEKNFDDWFNKFCEAVILRQFVQRYPSCRSYYDSLKLCQPAAFAQNAVGIYRGYHAGAGKYTNVFGRQFVDLKLPKIYCYGDESLPPESQEFLREYHVPAQVFHTDNHFVMQECLAEFVKFLAAWVRKL